MVNYRLAEEKDYESINAFYNKMYSANRTLEQFYWEFHNGPFGAAIYVVALDDDKVIGTNCVIPIELMTYDNKTIRSGKSEDTLVDPAYRGQKIFYGIYEYLFEKCEEAGIEVIWGFTSAKKPFKKLGFTVPYDHQQSLLVSDVRASYKFLSALNVKNKALDKFKILGLCLMSKMKGLGTTLKKNTEYELRVNEEVSSDRINALIRSRFSKGDNSFAINQNTDFQKWRIYNNPNFHKVHTYSLYNKKSELMGVIVFNSHKNKVAYVCQTTFHEGVCKQAISSILKEATKDLFSKGIVLVRNWHFDVNEYNREEIKLYKVSGYTYLEKGIGMVWKEIGGAKIDAKGFHLSRIATQGVL